MRTYLKEWCKLQGEFGKRLLGEWTGLDEYDNEVDINKISKGSHTRIKWHCQKCNEVWVVDVHNRTGYHTGCPYCAENSRSSRNMKATTHIGKNDLLTWCKSHGEYGAFLIDEWCGIFENGIAISMEKIARGSSKNVLWKCSYCKEEFYCSPNGRTSTSKRGCPFCNTRSTSYPEQFVYHALKEKYPDAISRGKFNDYEYDIMLPGANTFIEYSPTFTHNEKTERDNKKAEVCHTNGIRFISIIEDSFNEQEHYVNDSEICFWLDYNRRQACLEILVNNLFFLLNLDASDVDFEKVDELAFLRSHKRIDIKDSVYNLFPGLMREWNYDYNKSRNPKLMTPYAPEVIYWTCSKCNYGKNGEWRAILSNRTFHKQGCPACGYNWYDGTVHATSQPITIIGKTDFPSCCPSLYLEWNKEKNMVDPYKLRCSSHKRVFWKCNKCGFGEKDDWIVAVDARIRNKSGCPACGYNWNDDTYHITSGTSAVVEGKNDLASKYPNLLDEWAFDLNKRVSPFRVKAGSKERVAWICSKCGFGKDGKWVTKIGDRTQYQTGCPSCGYNSFKGEYLVNGNKTATEGLNDVASGSHSKILEEWHPSLNKVSPKTLKSSSHEKVYWKCTKCGYGENGEWNNSLNSRTNQKSGCPVCGYNYFDGTFHKTTGRSTVLIGINDLATTHPDYAKEWHPTLNGDHTPQKVKAGSHTSVYWKCPKCGYGENGEWYQDIHVRIKAKPLCKKCRRKGKK